MIRNRLSILLAERGLKITKVAKDTGISRNTITSTAQNDGKMIQLETINSLCIYLGITPGEFFEFSEYNVNFSFFSEEKLNSEFDFELEVTVYMDFNKGTQQYSLEFIGIIPAVEQDQDVNHSYESYHLDFKLQNPEEYKRIKDDISVGFWTDISKDFEDYIYGELKDNRKALIFPFGINIVFE